MDRRFSRGAKSQEDYREQARPIKSPRTRRIAASDASAACAAKEAGGALPRGAPRVSRVLRGELDEIAVVVAVAIPPADGGVDRLPHRVPCIEHADIAMLHVLAGRPGHLADIIVVIAIEA